jgi:hypothetical protein
LAFGQKTILKLEKGNDILNSLDFARPEIAQGAISLRDCSYQQRSLSVDFDGLTFCSYGDIFANSPSAHSTCPAE